MQGNKPVILQKDQALAVWEVLQCRKEPENEKQRIFCDRVERLYLPREYAPGDYLQMYPSIDAEEREQDLTWYQK